MNGYGLIAAIVQAIASLAWPAAVFGVAWLFRKELREALPKLRARYKDVELSFRLEQAEKEAAGLPTTSEQPGSKPTPEEKSRFEQLAEIAPRQAILETLAQVAEAVFDLAKQKGVAVSEGRRLRAVTRVLREYELIDARTSALLDDLDALLNVSLLSREEHLFTRNEAERIRRLADVAMLRLTGVLHDEGHVAKQ